MRVHRSTMTGTANRAIGRLQTMKVLQSMSFLAVVCSLTAAAHGQELTGTLKKIKETGSITLGARESAAPFSYSVESNHFTGYSYEIMLKVLDRIKAEL
jgi:glutamate/aspartate transport system substrate-binding protein